MMRRLLPLAAAVVVAAGCANSELGRSIPACPSAPGVVDEVSATMILQMQAVDTAEYVPCLNDLKAGWTYQDLVSERGRSRFWLDSDRLGSRFLQVTLSDRCDVTGLQEVNASQPELAEYRNVDLVGSTVTVVLVPVTGREADYARRVEAELEARLINDRQVFVVLDDGDRALADKVATAARLDRPIVIVDEQDALDRTVTLQMPDDDRSRRGLDFGDLVDVLESRLDETSFTGTWVTVFEGGCIMYEFDASGPGVDRLAGDVEEAIGLFPAGEVRRTMREIGVLG